VFARLTGWDTYVIGDTFAPENDGLTGRRVGDHDVEQGVEGPGAPLGGSDAGAHLDRMQGANYPTRFLADCLRGRRLTTLEDAVRMMTSVPSELFGLRDRGVVRDGAHADLVLFDPDRVDSELLTLVEDLPGGTGRLYAGSVGVRHVYVGGVEVVRDGSATDARPGAVVRSGVDTDTVLV
jgi:N-acyl-D-aspartate/D-glutamate deacylase